MNGFEFVGGLRNSVQIFYQNNLFRKHTDNQWRCSKCRSMITIDIRKKIVTKGPIPLHNGHGDVPIIRLAVLFAIKKMKEETRTNRSSSLHQIYHRNLKLLTDSTFSLKDIHDPQIGGLLPYPRFQNTLAKIREKTINSEFGLVKFEF